VYSEDIHAGYVRLIRERQNTELLLSDLHKLNADETLHGPAVLNDNKNIILNNAFSLSNVTADKAESEAIVFRNRDDVYAVHSPYWSVEATEWINSTRPHGFPSNRVIEQVVRYGCDFVQVSHKLSKPYSNEWRFSFSRAEYLIAKSWKMTQRIVYTALWVINKRIASGNLCTYYFKTLMLWACEKKPTQFWQDDFLLSSVQALLVEIISWLKLKSCPNYFIPGNNMMDHLIDTDLSYEIDMLEGTSKSYQLLTRSTDACCLYELISAHRTNHIESPAWLKRSFLICHRLDNDYDNYLDLFCTNLTTDLQNALRVELSDIYRGLAFQVKLVNCSNLSYKHINFLKSAESHLLLAVNQCESHERDAITNCTGQLVYLFVNDLTIYDADLSGEPYDGIEGYVQSMTSFRSCDIDPSSGAKRDYFELKTKQRSRANANNSVGDCDEQKFLLDSQLVENLENKQDDNYLNLKKKKIGEGRQISIEVHRVSKMDTYAGVGILFYKEWAGWSPTVNISWFIAKAYLANLYYTTQRDVSLTIQTCNDVIDVYKQSKVNNRYAERTFPVVLSTQWTSIYDKEIQELLGFYSLCSYVLDKCSSRSVYLGVCPVQFAHYVKVRTARDHRFNDTTIEKYVNGYNTHIEACFCDNNVKNGTAVVTRASRL